MKDLATYSFTNAKMRAMLSYLVKEDLFMKLLDSQDVYELLELLKETPYREILKGMSLEEDAREFERLCILNDIRLFRKIYDSLFAKKEREFVGLLIQRYEIDEIKVALRLWHKKISVEAKEYLIGEKVSYDIDFKRLLESETIEEIILLLDNTPYKKPLFDALASFKESGSMFLLETGLDKDYYKRLILATKCFSKRDRSIALKVLGVQIDIENIRAVIHLKKYQGMPLGDITAYLIPGGERIDKDSILQLYRSNGISGLIDNIAVGPYNRIKGLIEENAGFIEQFLYGILFSQIKRFLYGFPFTIGGVLGYIFLKQNETRNIISLVYAKKYNWKRDMIAPLLNIC